MLVAPMNRRALLTGATLTAAAIGLAGCTTTTVGGVTTVSLDVARVTAYAQAGLAAVTTVTALLAQFAGSSAYATQLGSAETALSAALAAFSGAAGPAVTVRYDDATIGTAVDSLLAGLQTIAGLIGTIAAALATQGVTSDALAKVKLADDALATIVATFRALLSTATALRTSPAPRLTMSEAQALRVLRRRWDRSVPRAARVTLNAPSTGSRYA